MFHITYVLMFLFAFHHFLFSSLNQILNRLIRIIVSSLLIALQTYREDLFEVLLVITSGIHIYFLNIY